MLRPILAMGRWRGDRAFGAVIRDWHTMASPQVENGFTRLANELLEALYRTDPTGGEWGVIMCVARASYGWGQKQAPVSIGEVARRLNKDYANTKRTARALMARNIVAKNGTASSS